MSKSIKLTNNTYIDSSGITHNQNKLSDVLTDFVKEVDVRLDRITSYSVGTYYRGVKDLSSYIPKGYKIVSIIPTYQSYGDRNFLQYNLYYQNNLLYWQMLAQYNGGNALIIEIRLYLVKDI